MSVVITDVFSLFNNHFAITVIFVVDDAFCVSFNIVLTIDVVFVLKDTILGVIGCFIPGSVNNIILVDNKVNGVVGISVTVPVVAISIVLSPIIITFDSGTVETSSVSSVDKDVLFTMFLDSVYVNVVFIIVVSDMIVVIDFIVDFYGIDWVSGIVADITMMDVSIIIVAVFSCVACRLGTAILLIVVYCMSMGSSASNRCFITGNVFASSGLVG